MAKKHFAKVEKSNNQHLTRKELRKKKRLLKKRSKCLFYEKLKQKNKPSTDLVEAKSLSEETLAENKTDVSSKIKKVTFSAGLPSIKQEKCLNKESKLKTTKTKFQKVNEKLLNQMKKQRKRQLLDAVKEDEKEIRILEKRLKLSKKKNKSISRGFVDCGLDYILDVCDPDRIHTAMNSEVNFEESDSDFFEDVSFIKGSKQSENSEKAESLSEISQTINSLQMSVCTKKDSVLNESNPCLAEQSKSEGVSQSEADLWSHEDTSSEVNFSEEQGEEDEQLAESNKVWEDIYGRVRDKQGNIIQDNRGKYVPPHSKDSESNEVTSVKKQLKGLLNRLAQSNLYSIANDIEQIYSKHSRNLINETLNDLFLGNVVNKTLTPECLIIDHAMLLAVLHANIGSEIGAYMLQSFIKNFTSMLSKNHPVENKELDNMLCLISYLYNFQIFEACLLYDILKKLCNQCLEKNIDLIIVVLKSVGFSLRKDDPIAMKQFLLNVQKQFSESSVKDSSRMKYMLSVLINIKNNNISKLSEFDPQQQEQHKKTLKLLIRKGNNIVPLRIGLDDLLKAEERGRWWLVGSAWKDEEGKIKNEQHNIETYSTQLLELAKKQKMNTDNRRNIFCILMTAEDYKDGFEKILRLGLKGQQEREIPLVIVHCLLQEKNYNPFYAFVAEQFCMSNRRHQITLQCALWDRFRDLGALSASQICSLAKFLSQLLIAGSLPISVLKVVEFTELDKRHIRLLRQTILSLANENNIESVKSVFVKVSKSKKLCLFREALKLFIHHFTLRNMDEGDLKNRVKLISSFLIEE